MLLTMMKGKLHQATVTEANLDYEGSVGIDADLMKAAGFLPNEQVDILNCTNGNRLTTYTITEPGGSGAICVQGAAAHLVNVGDKVIIVAYAQMDAEEAKTFKSSPILLDDDNNIKTV
jgi:aspartate 1-decarboxylase